MATRPEERDGEFPAGFGLMTASGDGKLVSRALRLGGDGLIRGRKLSAGSYMPETESPGAGRGAQPTAIFMSDDGAQIGTSDVEWYLIAATRCLETDCSVADDIGVDVVLDLLW